MDKRHKKERKRAAVRGRRKVGKVDRPQEPVRESAIPLTATLAVLSFALAIMVFAVVIASHITFFREKNQSFNLHNGGLVKIATMLLVGGFFLGMWPARGPRYIKIFAALASGGVLYLTARWLW